MDLIQIKHYLRGRKIAPLQDVAWHFQADVETVRPLINVWINKGKVRRYMEYAPTCKGCCKCDPSAMELYEWLEEPLRPCQKT